ncbi:MAG TPA: DNA repair protein RecN [Clostridia bacterium]|nr:DNA repair protein RecN [Clostridia bacterium]
MLMHLSVKNIALIDEISLDFDRGLNILTGETGAGKSIIIDAVNLVLGERADRDLIQTGKSFARVEALFSIGEHTQIDFILKEHGIQPEGDNTLLLARELSTNGKNVCRINGRIVTLSILRMVSKHLVDVHGQHQHQSLLIPEDHIQLLDMLGGQELTEIKKTTELLYGKWKGITNRIRGISGIGMDGERHKDILAYQIDEIENANLVVGEEEDLTKERDLLVNAEKIITIINAAYEDLYSGSSTYHSASDLLGKAFSEFEQISHLEPQLDSIYKNIETIFYQLEDAIIDVRNYRDGFIHDPFRLDEIGGRLELISSLKRKYGSSITEIYSYLENIKEELQELENSQELLEGLIIDENKAFHGLLNESKKLSIERKKFANVFQKQVLEQLAELGMDKSSFVIEINPVDDISDLEKIKKRITSHGYDRVEFMISTNPGEPVKPLSKIISGGEMSRIMLAFKTILAENDDIPTLIFDEIDVGISGAIAHVVGEKMGNISRSHQIICVTHLPHIAAMADNHYKIQKQYTAGHTRTMVEKLNDRESQEEIAKMTGGKTLSQASMDHALELMNSAQNFKKDRF